MEKAALKALTVTLSKVPQAARQAIFQKVPSPYGVTGVFAGETEAVHEHTLARCYEQYLVPIKGQADILVTRRSVHQPVQRELVPEPAARAGAW